MKAIVAITMGDPAGIGPEIAAKALSSPAVRKLAPLLVGDSRIIRKYVKDPCFRVVDVRISDIKRISAGRPSAASGRAAYEAFVKGLNLVQAGEARALVTAPVSKSAINQAGITFSGHTEELARRTGTKDFAMMMAEGPIRTVMVTRHLPLELVPEKIYAEEIVKTTLLSNTFLREHMGIRQPRLCVCALNPHAGEQGLLGSQELKKIVPAVKKLQKLGLKVAGPLPADSAWAKIVAQEFDLLVCMYHDQAMIGLKSVFPEKLVNITIGLPFIRTSPGHGTAFDIAGKGTANPSSMIEAILSAARLSCLV
jgi:4-hydroxythreonine-4-phosphate dehydrogenase